MLYCINFRKVDARHWVQFSIVGDGNHSDSLLSHPGLSRTNPGCRIRREDDGMSWGVDPWLRYPFSVVGEYSSINKFSMAMREVVPYRLPTDTKRILSSLWLQPCGGWYCRLFHRIFQSKSLGFELSRYSRYFRHSRHFRARVWKRPCRGCKQFMDFWLRGTTYPANLKKRVWFGLDFIRFGASVLKRISR